MKRYLIEDGDIPNEIKVYVPKGQGSQAIARISKLPAANWCGNGALSGNTETEIIVFVSKIAEREDIAKLKADIKKMLDELA